MAFRESLLRLNRRVAWYPGSEKRFAAFRSKFKDAEELGVQLGEDSEPKPEGYLPWLFKSGLSPAEVSFPYDVC